jgi:2-dehydropantoate 2-reductase
VNPITALTRQRQKVLRRDDVQDLAASLLAEAVAVARAEGAAMDPQEVERVLAQIRTFPEDAGSSMYFDVMAERPLEAEALTGAVVRAGGRHGIATPMNRAILTLATVLSDGLR